MELSGEIYFTWVCGWVCVHLCACLCVEWNNFLSRGEYFTFKQIKMGRYI